MAGENRRKWPSEFMKKGDKGKGAFCPKCGCRRSTVVRSRAQCGNSRQRRRQCANCGWTYSTFETQ